MSDNLLREVLSQGWQTVTVWVVALGLVAVAVWRAGRALVAAAGRARARRGDRDGSPAGARWFYGVALLAMAVSLGTSWQFFAENVPVDVRERALMFSVLEVALVACGVAMRGNVRRDGRPGAPRAIAWALCAVSAYMALVVSGPVIGPVRVALGPVLGLVMLHQALGIEIKHRTGETAGVLARVGREVRERALSRLGLADDDRDAITRTRERAARRAARLALAAPGRIRDARYRRALRIAQPGTDSGARQVMLAELATLKHAAALAALEVPAPWDAATGQAPVIVTTPGVRDDRTGELETRDRSSVTGHTGHDDQTVRSAPVTGGRTAGRVTVLPVTYDPDQTDQFDQVTERPVTAVDSTDREHRDRLAGMTSDAQRVRYAVDVTGRDRPAGVVAWLTGYGHAVTVEAARSTMRRMRTATVATATG